MGKRIPVNYENQFCYNIVIEEDFAKLGKNLQELKMTGERKICIVTDSNVAPLYLEKMVERMGRYFQKIVTFTFPAGEESKNLKTVEDLYEKLIIEHFDRKDILMAFGGGVVGDLTGYTAATYMRGIDFVQVPTTLLSQVDSSIGGKTGVDFKAFKNMVGAFYMPRLVYMNLSTLKTLPDRVFYSGFGEVLKHGLIKNRIYFQWLRDHVDEILNQDYHALEHVIAQSCHIKKLVVENDPKEHGERALLNFGHTIGHAVEKCEKFQMLHGECVALGMMAACEMSRQRKKLTQEDCDFIKETISLYHLPVRSEHPEYTVEDVLIASKSDKKMDGKKVKFIILEELGKASIYTEFSDTDIKEGILFLRQ